MESVFSSPSVVMYDFSRTNTIPRSQVTESMMADLIETSDVPVYPISDVNNETLTVGTQMMATLRDFALAFEANGKGFSLSPPLSLGEENDFSRFIRCVP